jgi:hypothetical protein
MKHLRGTTLVIACSILFLLFSSISDAGPHKATDKRQDCISHLKQVNQVLQSDPDGILDEGQIADYENCVNSIGDIDTENVANFILLLDCYTNLMDYYEYVKEDDDTAAEWEDKINEITQ